GGVCQILGSTLHATCAGVGPRVQSAAWAPVGGDGGGETSPPLPDRGARHLRPESEETALLAAHQRIDVRLPQPALWAIDLKSASISAVSIPSNEPLPRA